jgi:DNA (cytosine-5)-methyltransferase 1
VTAYYNENNAYAAEWLRNLIAAGRIAPGDVDERSIEDVTPNDIKNYTQCHFFAGIGVWSHALRLAGWPDDRPVWTGSCPCQPFSNAGQGAGFADERHLWPAWQWLIEQCRPAVVLGEQVASKDGLAWFDRVQTDLENADYTVGAADLCAAGVGAPHIRQRLWFAGHTGAPGLPTCEPVGVEGPRGREERRAIEQSGGTTGGLADLSGGRRGKQRRTLEPEEIRHPDSGSDTLSGLANADGRDAGAEGVQRGGEHGQQPQDSSGGDIHRTAGPTNGHWRTADWLCCRDGKWRPVEPGTFPLAHGAAARVGRLRAYGNAINAEVARVFIDSVMDCLILE